MILTKEVRKGGRKGRSGRKEKGMRNPAGAALRIEVASLVGSRGLPGPGV